MNMSKSHNQSNQRNQNHSQQNNASEYVSREAKKYTQDIQLLLEIDTATTDNIKKGVDQVQELVKTNNTITTHQIRNIFKLVMDAKDIRDLNMIRPKLSYVSARQRGDDGKIIAQVVDDLIVNVTATKENKLEEKIKGLKYIMESIVAYHKFHVKER